MFLLLEQLTLTLLLKLFLLILIFGLCIFSFVLITQIKVMNRVIHHSLLAEIIIIISLLLLFVSISLFLATLVIL